LTVPAQIFAIELAILLLMKSEPFAYGAFRASDPVELGREVPPDTPKSKWLD
jgi:hypothetical protein